MKIPEEKKINPNTNIEFNPIQIAALFGKKWVSQNTAILVVHGIGNQFPLETLDGFGRGLINTYNQSGRSLKFEHHIVKKSKNDSSIPWFDNYLRIFSLDHTTYIDIYEYYWAPETEDQASLKDLDQWLSNVTNGARKFYKDNVSFAKENNDRSVFIENNEFNAFGYWFCVYFVPLIFTITSWISTGLVKLLLNIPIIGGAISLVVNNKWDSTVTKIANILNDVSIYNTTDPKSRFFKIRSCIRDGAVNALKHLLEAKTNENGQLFFEYDRVLLAGHSLGSQIAFDAINQINHLVNQNEIKGYTKQGDSNIVGNSIPIAKRLSGLVTFGSPLDKIAFFLREQTSESEYLRNQILNYYHGFKQREWIKLMPPESLNFSYNKIDNQTHRLFENIHWRNYWDARDYVSGALDYYKDVTNIDCKFQSEWHSFTHSRYWNSTDMYLEIIEYYLD